FGTWEPETEPVVFGITRPLSSFNPIWAQLAGYADLVQAARRAPSAWLALQVFVRSPGWHPEWMGEAHVAPTTPQEQQKYAVAPSRAAKAYATTWFALMAVVTFSLLMWGRGLSGWPLLAVVAWVYATLLAMSGALEGKRWVRVL